MEVIKRREEERRRRLEKAKVFAESVKELFDKVTVVVIGSTMRGDFNVWSDVDVVVISDKLPRRVMKRFDIFTRIAMPGIEAIPLRPEDALRLAEKRAPVAHEIANGVVIFDDLRIISKIKRIISSRRPARP